MATLRRATWPSNPAAPRRSERMACHYDAYLPDPLSSLPVLLPDTTAAAVADAEAAIRSLDACDARLVSAAGVAGALLRAESVASSRIEEVEVGARRLAKAAAARAEGVPPRHPATAAVLANLDAIALAVSLAGRAAPFTTADLCSVHAELTRGELPDQHVGTVRTEQNWIGGSSYTPAGAAFVPPPPDVVPALLDDLTAFVSGDTYPPLVQAALAHAQFETVHPFLDGNGRTGRALVQVVLRRRGLAPRFVPPVSLALAADTDSYVAGLTAFRHVGDPADPAALAGVARWVGLFAGAARRAALDAATYVRRLDEVVEGWRARAAPVEPGSAADLLLAVLPAMPVVTPRAAATLTGSDDTAAGAAVERLVAAGVLRQVTIDRRERAYEAVGLLDVISAFERPPG